MTLRGLGGLLKQSECRHMEERGLKLLKKPSYNIWTFLNSRSTCNSVNHLQNVDYSLITLLCILSLLLYVKLNKIVQKEKSSHLPMVSKSLTLTFYLLTGYYSRQQPSSLRLGDVIFWEWSVSELSGFWVFLEDDGTDLCENFFQGLGENTWSL